MSTLPATLNSLVERMGGAIARAVIDRYPPRYTPRVRAELGFEPALDSLRRKPLGAQADIVRALAMELRDGRSALLVAEMGTGKTFCAIAAAHLANKRRILVYAPPHLVQKWKREVECTLRWSVAPAIVRTPTELERALHVGSFAKQLWIIVPETAAKLGYGWRPAAVPRRRFRNTALACPDCGAPVQDREGNLLTLGDLSRRKLRCLAPSPRRDGPCDAALWTAQSTPVGRKPFPGLGEPGAGPRRVPLADYIARCHQGTFDLLIADEVHRAKGRGTAAGFALGTLARTSRQSLALTGTLMSGYASSLFYLLHRLSPPVRREFRWSDEARWIERYGRVERITRKDRDEVMEDGASSRRKAYRTTVQEKPGVSPMVLLHLIGCTVFARLADVATDLPPYEERVELVSLDYTTVDGVHVDGTPETTTHEHAYTQLAGALRERLIQLLQTGSKRLLGAYLQSLLAYPDGCTHAEEVIEPGTDMVVGRAPALPADRLYPKERRLVDLCLAERERGRRVLIFVQNTEKRDLTPRFQSVLEGAGLRTAILKSDTVKPEAREVWVRQQVDQGKDVLIGHPRLVSEGLDLLWFPTLVWAQIDASVFTLRQASRRSWRIGQRQPVRVHFLVYAGTLQAKLLHLVATKLQASLAVEGELPEDGLAADEADDDVFLALARQAVADSDGHDGGLEALFADAASRDSNDALLLADQDREDVLEIAPRTALPEEEADPEPAKVLSLDEFRRRVGLSDETAKRAVRRSVVPKEQLSLFG